MKSFIVMLFINVYLVAFSVDTKLYEGEQREAYYEEIQKQIEFDESKKQKPIEIINEEKLYLSRLRNASSQTIQIVRYDLKNVLKKQISFNDYYNALNALSSVRIKQKVNQNILMTVNDKSIFLKRTVENIIEQEKQKLLSYQLQYAYYRVQETNIKEKLKLLEEYEKEIKNTVFSSFKSLKCSPIKDIKENLKASDADIEKKLFEKVSLQINLEKALIEESAKIENIKQKISSIEILYQQELNKQIMNKIELSLCMLKKNQNKEFFKILDEIETDKQEISTEEIQTYIEELKILRNLAKEVFGSTKLFFGATLYEITEMLMQLKGYFSSTLFVFNEHPISLFSLIKAVFIIIVGLFIGMLYKRWIAKISLKWPNMSQMSVRLASNIGYYFVFVISFIFAIGSLGIDLTSISLIAGALSIGIGFGLQTVASNLIAGIILMFERTIRIGDTVEISDTLRGRVTDMRIRSTTIKTFDNVDIVVPNSSFIQNNVINWTLDDILRRIHIPFSVAYGTSVEDVKSAVLGELEQSDLKYINNSLDKQPEIWMVSMNNSSVDFELLIWIEWDRKLRPNSLKSDFLILIYNALNKHGIQIPFPQLDLHVKEMPLGK